MPNETIFFIHALIVLSFTFGALKLGKEALFSWIALQGILSNLFVLKQMDCFGLTITCSDVYVIGAILGLNFLQEFFDKDSAKKATYLSFYAMIFFSLISFLHLSYLPSPFDTTQELYKGIFSIMPKMALVSLVVFFISQRFDVFFFGLLKKGAPFLPFSLRSGLSMIISQCLDTALFTFFALRDVVEDPMSIFLVSFLIKCIVVIFMNTVLQATKKYAYS